MPFRHEHNKLKDVEPEANQDFFNDTNIKKHG